MSELPNNPKLDSCGCCEVAESDCDARVNPPGQPQLSYRLGKHACFLRRMLERLPTEEVVTADGQHVRPLANLTVRSSDDPTIGLLDAWAVVADVLTFYQERIANEGFLRTATERRSILELARTVGYELNPGVAAGTYLAFTVKDAKGSPIETTVPEGVVVQNVPFENKLPQTFETIEEIEARVEWNAIKPCLSLPQELALYEDTISVPGETKLELVLLALSTSFTQDIDNSDVIPISVAELQNVYPLDSSIDLSGVDSEIQALRVQEIYLQGIKTGLTVGDRLLLVGERQLDSVALKTACYTVVGVETDYEDEFTQVELQTDAAAVARKNFTKSLAPMIKDWVWGSYAKYKDGSILGSPFGGGSGTPPPADEIAAIEPGIFAFSDEHGFFGHNAPLFNSLPDPDYLRDDPYPPPPGHTVFPDWDDIDGAGGGLTRKIWENCAGAPWDPDKDVVFLERVVPDILDGSWAVFEDPDVGKFAYYVTATSEESLAQYALTGKATRLTLDGPFVVQNGGTYPPPSDLGFRRTSAWIKSRQLGLSQIPVRAPLAAGETALMLDVIVGGLEADQPVGVIVEDKTGARTGEVVQIEAVVKYDAEHTLLVLRGGLQHSYERKKVTFNANVAGATHGETFKEILGSGNEAAANQSFTLKTPPLTYVSAPTPSGGKSTLSVRVNGLLWEETESLYGLDDADQAYLIRIDDESKAEVTFGDGERGARLPTGQDNVVAKYRSGIGLDGEVNAGSLTLLLSRPLGIEEVTNPESATGAESPETMDKARTSAPLTLLTMDRIVSLQDYEDFTRTFAGIGKAKVVVLWDGERDLVHITVASASGDIVDPAAVPPSLYSNLVEAIDSARDPIQKVRVDTFVPRSFSLEAKVLVDTRYESDVVLQAARTALLEAFGFEQRAFGQPVAASEVLSVIQSVAGVVAVDLDKLWRDDEFEGWTQTAPESYLPATLPHWCTGAGSGGGGGMGECVGSESTGYIQKADLLLINPSQITLEEMMP